MMPNFKVLLEGAWLVRDVKTADDAIGVAISEAGKRLNQNKMDFVDVEVGQLDCPGCGSQRALHELLHGNLTSALRLNAFVVCSLPLFAWLGLDFAWRRSRGLPTRNFHPLWLWLYLAAFITFGILRDLPIPLFAVFAP